MPEEIGISVVNNGEGTQPFMVAFLEARNEIPESRYLREISTTASTTNNRVKKNFQSMMMFDEDDSFFTSTPCRVHTLYVSFKDLGWEVCLPSLQLSVCWTSFELFDSRIGLLLLKDTLLITAPVNVFFRLVDA
jgi:hypothetical protein